MGEYFDCVANYQFLYVVKFIVHEQEEEVIKVLQFTLEIHSAKEGFCHMIEHYRYENVH